MLYLFVLNCPDYYFCIKMSLRWSPWIYDALLLIYSWCCTSFVVLLLFFCWSFLAAVRLLFAYCINIPEFFYYRHENNWDLLDDNYKKTPFFSLFKGFIKALFAARLDSYLIIQSYLFEPKNFLCSIDSLSEEHFVQRIMPLCTKCGGNSFHTNSCPLMRPQNLRPQSTKPCPICGKQIDSNHSCTDSVGSKATKK